MEKTKGIVRGRTETRKKTREGGGLGEKTRPLHLRRGISHKIMFGKEPFLRWYLKIKSEAGGEKQEDRILKQGGVEPSGYDTDT